MVERIANSVLLKEVTKGIDLPDVWLVTFFVF